MSIYRTCFVVAAAVLCAPALIGLVDAMWWFYTSGQLTGVEWDVMPRSIIAVLGAAFGLFFAGIASDPRLWSN